MCPQPTGQILSRADAPISEDFPEGNPTLSQRLAWFRLPSMERDRLLHALGSFAQPLQHRIRVIVSCSSPYQKNIHGRPSLLAKSSGQFSTHWNGANSACQLLEEI